ncbi:hypothetical protein IIB34_01795 [PVC group bacterium]|nr:hypothetical protein [PVC group bacterium]
MDSFKKIILYLVFVSIMGLILDKTLAAEEEILPFREIPKNIREAYGFRYDLPDDYPIQKIKGVVRPIELSDYVYMKLGEMKEQIHSLKNEIAELEKKVRVLEGDEPEKEIEPVVPKPRFLSIEDAEVIEPRPEAEEIKETTTQEEQQL